MSSDHVTPFVNPSLNRLLQALSSAWTDGLGYWRPLPDYWPDVAALRDTLTKAGAIAEAAPALYSADAFALGALFTYETPYFGTLHLTVATWHRLMLHWPAGDAAGLAILARVSTAANQPGADVVEVGFMAEEWAQFHAAVAAVLGTSAIVEGDPFEGGSLGRLHAALVAATGQTDLVIADTSPFDDSNRFAHFAVAINRVDGVADSIYMSRASYEAVRAHCPEAMDDAAIEVLTNNGVPIGVVRVPLAALWHLDLPQSTGGLVGQVGAINAALSPVDPAEWAQGLVRRGLIEAGHIVNTSLDSHPETLAAFNAAVQHHAFASSFTTPEPGAFSFSDATRQAWLDEAVSAATAPIQQAAAWLNLVRQALDNASAQGAAVVQDGWVHLDAATAALVDPGQWPADHALLQASLVLAGDIQRTIAGFELTGRLDRELRDGETLVVDVNGQPAGAVSVDNASLTWSLTLAPEEQESWRSVTVKRTMPEESDEVVQRFEVLAGQVSDSTAVRATSLARWLGDGSLDLGKSLATLIGATIGVASQPDGLAVIDVEGLRELLLDPALQQVLKLQGLNLPASPESLALTATADRIAANGHLFYQADRLAATRETLQAWASLAEAGGGYDMVPSVPRARGLGAISAPVQQLTAPERELLEALATASETAASTLRTAHRTAAIPTTSVDLALNLPPGSDYTLETSADNGASWIPLATLADAPSLGHAPTLLRVSNVVLPDGRTPDTPLTLTAIRSGNSGVHSSASVLLQDATLPRLVVQTVEVVEDEAGGYARFEVQLTEARGNGITLDLQLQHVTPDGVTADQNFEQLIQPPNQEAYWLPVDGQVVLEGSGQTQKLVLRHALPAGVILDEGEAWRLQVSASGESAVELASTTVSADVPLFDRRPQSIAVTTQDVGQGEGEVHFEVTLTRAVEQSIQLDLLLALDPALVLGQHEISRDGGKSWEPLYVAPSDPWYSASVTLNRGDAGLLLRSQVDGLNGTWDNVSAVLMVENSLDLPMVEATSRVWRFDGTTPLVWVDDVLVDDAGSEAVFTVRLSGAIASAVELDYATALPSGLGAADPLRDFLETSGRLIFEAGQTQQQVRVPLRVGWEDVADPRSFELHLSHAVNAHLADGRGVATLQGELPSVAIAGAVVNEATQDHAYFQVGLSRASSSAITLRIGQQGDADDGQADLGALQYLDEGGNWVDYEEGNGLTLGIGQTQVLVRAALNRRDPDTFEIDEQIELSVSAHPASADRLSGTSARATLQLRGNADPATVRAQADTGNFSDGAVFSLGLNDLGWVGLAASDIEALRTAMRAAGMDDALLDEAQHLRPDPGNSLVPVYDPVWLDALQQALDLRSEAHQLREALDDVVAVHAHATPTILGSASAWEIDESVDWQALVDRLAALNLPAQLQVVMDPSHPLGSVLVQWDADNKPHVFVTDETLTFWSAELQRQQESQMALALYAQAQLHADAVEQGPVSIGTTADGTGTADRWLAELAAMGVPLLDAIESAYDPEAIGAIYRRRDADGVERLYVSADTLFVWEQVLAERAALATSTYNGGLDSYADTYLRNLARVGHDLSIRHADFAKVRLAYAASTTIRNIYWMGKDMTIERMRQFSTRFYKDLHVFRSLLPDPKLGIMGVPSVEALYAEIDRLEESLYKLSGTMYVRSTGESFQQDLDVARTYLRNDRPEAAWEVITTSTQSYFDDYKSLYGQPDQDVLTAMLDRAEYLEYAKEAEQVSRMVTSFVAIGLVVPGAWNTIAHQIEDGDTTGAVSNIAYTLNIALQSTHVWLWIYSGVLDTHLNNQQVVHRNEELLRRTLRAWAGDGLEVWDGIKVAHRMKTQGAQWTDAQSTHGLPSHESGKTARVTLTMDDGSQRLVFLEPMDGFAYVWESVAPEGSPNMGLELSWNDTDQRYWLQQRDPVTQEMDTIGRQYFDVALVDKQTGHRVDPRGRFVFRDGTLIPMDTVRTWNALSAAEKRLISPEALHLARTQYEGQGLEDLFTYTYDSYAPEGADPVAQQGNLFEDLRTRSGFSTTEHGKGHSTAITRWVDEIRSWPALYQAGAAAMSGQQAHAAATSVDTFGNYVLGKNDELTGFIDKPVAPKGTWQGLKDIGRNMMGTLSSNGEFAREVVEAFKSLPTKPRVWWYGSKSIGSNNPVLDPTLPPADQQPAASTSVNPDQEKLSRFRKQTRVKSAEEMYVARFKASGQVLTESIRPGPWFWNLRKNRNRFISSEGKLAESLGSPMRYESVNTLTLARTHESQRLVGQYLYTPLPFLGRYAALWGSDLFGIVGGVAALVDLADRLSRLPDDEAHRIERIELQGEIAKQSVFAFAYTGLFGAHIALAITELPKVPAPVTAITKEIRGFVHGMEVFSSIMGSLLVLSTEIVAMSTYAARWARDDQDRAAGRPDPTRNEDVWGTMGAVSNLAVLALTMGLAARFPALAPFAALGTMVLPNWSAIGRGRDLEDQVHTLRADGRDLEAAFVQTMSALSYRTAVPIYGMFSSFYAKPMIQFQMAMGQGMQDLLNHDARNQLQVTAEGGGNGLAVFEAGYTHGYLNYASPVHMVADLNPYLTGNGRQIDWAGGAASVDTDAFRAMKAQSARAMLDRMQGQADGQLHWFVEAARQRVQAELMTWEDPQSIGEKRKRALSDMAAYLREKANDDRSAALLWDTETYEVRYRHVATIADEMGQRFRSPNLRIVGDLVYDGPVVLGNLRAWHTLAASIDSGNYTAEDIQAREDRYLSRLILAHFAELVEIPQVDQAVSAIDRDTPDFGLAKADRLLSMLFSAESASDLFFIASRSESFTYDQLVHTRTMGYSNYSAHADAGENEEIVDFSYLQHVGRPEASADGQLQPWGDWLPLDAPAPIDPLPEDASAEDTRLYNDKVLAYNNQISSYNAHLLSYLDSVLLRPEEQRGQDLAPPPLVLSALAPVEPPGDASAEDLALFTAAQLAFLDIAGHAATVKDKRRQVLEARYLRLQNVVDANGNATAEQRFAVSAALDQVDFRFDMQWSGNQDNGVAERWVIGHGDVARDSTGKPLGTDMRVVIRDEGGNTFREIHVNTEGIDDLDQIFQVERSNVRLETGDGDDTFFLATAQGVHINSGAGELDQALFTAATEGQHIRLDDLEGVVRVVGSEYDDVVTSEDDANHHYVDHMGVLPPEPGQSGGDDVRITGPGDHLIEISAGKVLTGAGDDMVSVREHGGGSLTIDLGGGTNTVSFVQLPGVVLDRDSATGDYRFKQVTWVLPDGAIPDDPTGILGWGLQGTMRNVQQVIGSDHGDRMDISGAIEAINANGGDDRITLNSGNVVVDGGAGADTVRVLGAHNTRVLMDEQGDRVFVGDLVEDVMIAVGTRASEQFAASGPGIERGEIHAQGSQGEVLVDVVDGTVRVFVGAGHTVINLLSSSARVVIEDNADRLAAGGTIEINLLPGSPLDDLALRTHLAQSHMVVNGSGSLLDGMVTVNVAQPAGAGVTATAREHHVYEGISLDLNDLTGQARRIDLAQALPDDDRTLAPAATVRAIESTGLGDTLHAWAGVRTVIDLQPGQRFEGAYGTEPAQARAGELLNQRDDAEALQTHALDVQQDMQARHAALLAQAGAATDVPWDDPVALAHADLQQWIARGGATIDRWVFNAGDLLHSQSTLGEANLGAALKALGWSAEHGEAVASALEGHAVYSARLGTLMVSAQTLAAWRAGLQGLRSTAPPESLEQIDALDGVLAQVNTAGADGGVLHADMAAATGLLVALAQLGVIAPEQASIITGVERAAVWGDPALRVLSVGFDAAASPLLTGLGVDAADGDPTSPAAYRATEGEAVVLWNSHTGGFLTSRGALLNWITNAHDRASDAAIELQRIDAELAEVAPYRVTQVSGEALGTGLVNDTVTNTLEVDRDTPVQIALDMHATNGVDSATTPLWVQVERFQGITRVGDDLANHLVADGAHANLLAGGREWDLYTVRSDDDVVFENVGEGVDTVIGLGTAHTLNDNVENLRLAHDGEGPVTLHGTGNELNNTIEGHQTHDNVLNGGAGADVMWGGLGDDVYVVDNLQDIVRDQFVQGIALIDGAGIDEVISSVDYSLVEGEHLHGQIEHLSFVGTADLQGWGNALDNSLRGNAGNNRFDGGAGHDSVVLSGGVEQYLFLRSAGGEWIVGDRQGGRDGVDRLHNVEQIHFAGTGQTLAMDELPAHSVLAYIASHDDLIDAYGTDEARAIAHYIAHGNAEGREVTFDPLRYQASHVDLLGHYDSASPDDLARHYIQWGRNEQRSTDAGLQIQVASGPGTLDGAPGQNDALFGSAGDDLLHGGVGSDALRGGAGNDLLDGGMGADRLAGNAGDDTYFVDDAGDQIYEEANQGVDTVHASLSHTLGANLEHLVLTNGYAIDGSGNELNNTLTGNSASNVLSGGGGDDRLIGGRGSDTLDGGQGSDTAVFSGQPADYLILRVSENDWIVGDRVSGRDGADRLRNVEQLHFAGSGQTLAIGASHWHSVLAYGASYPDLSPFGTDREALAGHYLAVGHAQGRQVSFDPLRYLASHVDLMGFYDDTSPDTLAAHYIQWGRAEGRSTDLSLQVQVAGSAGTLNGQPGRNDALFGSAGDDQLFGGDGNDALRGGTGHDWLDGGSGADRMAGNAGDDTYVVDNAGDAIVEMPGHGSDTVRASLSHTLGANLEHLVLTGDSNINGSGNAQDNTLQGNAGRNVLDGGAGTDTVVLDAPLSAYQFLRQSNGDVLLGHRDPALGRADRLVNVEQLKIAATGEVIDLQSLAMPTVMDYLAANPQLVASIGTSEATAAEHYLGTGQQQGLTVDATFVVQKGTANGEYLNGQSGRDALFGEAGRDSLNGGPGDDALFGGDGDDMLNGADGQDTMVGGKGADRLEGSNGSDVYHFARGDGADIIEEVISTTDQDRLVFGTNNAGEIGANQLWFTRSGNDVIASVMGSTDSVRLQDWYGGRQVETITAADTFTSASGDLRTLSAAGLEQLVNAMASMAPPAGATSWGALTAGQQLELMSLGVWTA